LETLVKANLNATPIYEILNQYFDERHKQIDLLSNCLKNWADLKKRSEMGIEFFQTVVDRQKEAEKINQKQKKPVPKVPVTKVDKPVVKNKNKTNKLIEDDMPEDLKEMIRDDPEFADFMLGYMVGQMLERVFSDDD